jgi:hypothetical protein
LQPIALLHPNVARNVKADPPASLLITPLLQITQTIAYRSSGKLTKLRQDAQQLPATERR